MSNLDKYFKGQQVNEEFICFFRNHWIVLAKSFGVFLLLIVVSFIVASNIGWIQEVVRGSQEIKLLFFTSFLLVTIYFHKFFNTILNFFVNIGIITDMRIIDHKKTLFFTDTMEAVDMANIQNLERITEGFLPNVLQYGDIKIYLAASSTIKTFYGVPNAKFHFRCISRQKEARESNLRKAGVISKNPIAPANLTPVNTVSTSEENLALNNR